MRRGECRLFCSNCSWASANISSLIKAGTAISIQSWRGRS